MTETAQAAWQPAIMKSVTAHVQLRVLEMDFLMSQSCFHWADTQKEKMDRGWVEFKHQATVFLT